MTDLTGRKLFFGLLREARELKFNRGWSWSNRRGYLLGMLRTMITYHEDLRVADAMRDVWKNQNAGSES